MDCLEGLLSFFCFRPRAEPSKIATPDLWIPPAHRFGSRPRPGMRGGEEDFVPLLRPPRPAAPAFAIVVTPPSPPRRPISPPVDASLLAPPPRPDLIIFSLHSIEYDLISPPDNPIFTLAILGALVMSSSNTPHNAGISQSWISPAASNIAKYNRLQIAASYLGIYRSPFFPHSATEWNKHNAEMKSVEAVKQRKVLEEKIRVLEVRRKDRNASGDRVGAEETKINECELAFRHKDETEIDEEVKNGEIGWSVGLSAVLGEKTAFWAGGEELLKEGKVDEENGMRAFWPDMGELKYEGETRAKRTNIRRLPLPRLDLYSTGMLRHFIPPASPISQTEKGSLVDLLIDKKALADIAWFERQVVPFKYKLDQLPCLDRLWEANERTNNGGPYFKPASEDDVKTPPVVNEVKEELDIVKGYEAGHDEGHEPGAASYEQNLNNNGKPPIQTGQSQNQDTKPDKSSNPEPTLFDEFHTGFDSHAHPTQINTSSSTYDSQPLGNHVDANRPPGAGMYDDVGLPPNYSDGAEGAGNGKRCPAGGWMFDEGELRRSGDWAGLLDELDCVGDLEV
ncbi:hypothetical protein WAI453_006405 [Rhynchosporium graminicola]